MFKKLLPFALACFIPAAAMAGSYEDGRYTSSLGYTIEPPMDWVRVDAATVDAQKGALPENISEIALDRFDVVFFPKPKSFVDTSKKADDARIERNKEQIDAPENMEEPAIHMGEPEAFAPTLSVFVIKHAPSGTEPEYAKAYAENIVKMVEAKASYAKNFKVVNATQDEYSGPDVYFRFNIELQQKERLLKMEQTVIFHNSNTYVVTCTEDDNESFGDKNWCRKAVGSIKFK